MASSSPCLKRSSFYEFRHTPSEQTLVGCIAEIDEQPGEETQYLFVFIDEDGFIVDDGTLLTTLSQITNIREV